MQIKQISAKDLVGGMIAVLRDAGLTAEPINWNITTNAPGVALNLGNPTLNALLEHPHMKGLTKLIEQNEFLVCTAFNVNGPQNQAIIHFQAHPDAIIGTFTVHEGRTDKVLPLMKALRTHFNVFSRAVTFDVTQKEALTAGLKQQEVANAALEAQARRLQEFMEKSAREERERTAAFRAELEKDFLTRKSELERENEARKVALENEHKASFEALKKRQDEFEQKVKEFETQESKLVRRKLLKQFEEAVAQGQKAQLSPGTEKKRRGVHYVVWALEAIAGSVLGVTLYRFASGEAYDWHLALPLTASLGTMVSTAVYYLRWLDRWYREHADLEFMSGRYKADMLRASWVAELTAEMHALGEGASVPPQLLDALTRTLFRSQQDAPSEHPVEQLMSMVKRGTEVSITKDGLSLKAESEKK